MSIRFYSQTGPTCPSKSIGPGQAPATGTSIPQLRPILSDKELQESPMSRVLRCIVLSILVLSSAAYTSHATELFAALHGTVSDASGAVVPGATVTVTNTGTGIRSVARSDR